jgi:hypothetical protein
LLNASSNLNKQPFFNSPLMTCCIALLIDVYQFSCIYTYNKKQQLKHINKWEKFNQTKHEANQNKKNKNKIKLVY